MLGGRNKSVLDFTVLQAAFASGDPAADINGDGTLNALDFIAFQTLFQVPCA